MSRKQDRGKEPLPHGQTHRSDRSTTRICTDGGRDSIDSIAIIDPKTAHHVSYDGPFARERDGHCVEVTIPIGEGRTEICRETATHLSPAIIGHIALTTWATTVAKTGRIVAAEIEEESVVTIRFDDGGYSDAETEALLDAKEVTASE